MVKLKSSGMADKFKDRIQEAKAPGQLRSLLHEIEQEVKSIVGKEPLRYYSCLTDLSPLEDINELLRCRKNVLERMFTYSPAEVEAIERTNAQLTPLRKKMFRRTANLYRSALKDASDKDFDQDYMAEGKLWVEVDFCPDDGDYGTVIYWDNDDYYRSDFAYMLTVIRYNQEEKPCTLGEIDSCHVNHLSTNFPEMSDTELGCDFYNLDDGSNWAESVWHQSLKHIRFGHAFYAIYDYLPFSLADIIRIKIFTVDVTLTCQHWTGH